MGAVPPIINAELYLEARYSDSRHPRLLNQGNTFFHWNVSCWPEARASAVVEHIGRCLGGDAVGYEHSGVDQCGDFGRESDRFENRGPVCPGRPRRVSGAHRCAG